MPPKPDRLSALINSFRVDTHVLSLGACRVPALMDKGLQNPNLFIITKGSLHKYNTDFPENADDTPVLVFFPHGGLKGVCSFADTQEAEFICASVDMGGDANPIALALPDVVTIPLNEAKALKAVADMLITESYAPRCGGNAVIDRLCEIMVIQLLRHLMEKGEAEVGLIAGLTHPNLSYAIVAMHNDPQKTWLIEDFAQISGMSRTHFSNTFHKVVGVPAGEYLSSWRLSLARAELARGTRLKAVVQKVGFSSSAALSRAFKRRYGVTPRQDLLNAS